MLYAQYHYSPINNILICISLLPKLATWKNDSNETCSRILKNKSTPAYIDISRDKSLTPLISINQQYSLATILVTYIVLSIHTFIQ